MDSIRKELAGGQQPTNEFEKGVQELINITDDAEFEKKYEEFAKAHNFDSFDFRSYKTHIGWKRDLEQGYGFPANEAEYDRLQAKGVYYKTTDLGLGLKK